MSLPTLVASSALWTFHTDAESGKVWDMRIVVCVKRVPDAQAERRFDEDGFLVRGDDDVLNELDENAVQAAVDIVDAAGGGEIIAVTMGPEDAVDVLRRSLALGADRALHICDDRAAGSDVLGTAKVLAAAVRRVEEESGPVDIVLAGLSALDGMTTAVPPALAVLLDRPSLVRARRVHVDGSTIRIDRKMGAYEEVLEADLPVVLSVTDQANEVKYPNFKAIMAAKRKPIDEIDLDDLQLAEQVGAAGAGAKVVAAQPRPAKEAGEIVTENGAARLAQYINEVIS